MYHPQYCFICNDKLDNDKPTSIVKQKGLNTLIQKSKARKDNKWQGLENLTMVTVHEQCRVNYSVSKKPVSDETATAAPQVPPEPPFSFEVHCFLCCKPWVPKDKPGRLVCTPKAQERIETCINSRNDEWAEKVRRTIEGQSLIEKDARYHVSCWDLFTRPRKNNAGETQRLPELDAAFERVCRYMEESDDCQFTFKELLEKMKDWTTTQKTLKQKLINKYGPDIVMVERQPKPTIICFRNTGYKILETFWEEKKSNSQEDERLRIVRAAAAIIREDIQSKAYETSSYPRPEELLQNVEADIPGTLLTFLDDVLLKGKKSQATKLKTKRNSIGHAIISAVRPRSFISSIQLGTGVYFNRKFGSRTLIDVSNKLGFCTSYTNVSLYEASAIVGCDKKIENEAFMQHVFDNADHNVCTLDGFNTFHNMGGICCVTPKTGVSTQGVIQKLTRVPKAHELAAKYNIPIVCSGISDNSKIGMQSIKFTNVSQLVLGDRDELPAAYSLHIFAKSLEIGGVPSWRGYMEALTHSSDYDVSQIHCMPFVNLPPSNFDTIYTVLDHVHKKSKDRKQKTCFVTFDQPLYIKARELLARKKSLLKGVIVRLGGFHLLMSFLGAIGVIMDGSGLKELLEIIYASNSVDHILTGHAFSRAIRAHLLVYAALGAIIAKNAGNIGDEDREYMANLLKEFDVHPPTLDDVQNDENLELISEKLVQMMETLASVGRTSRLWLQYFHCITLVMQFIEAERLGNWDLHLQCIRDMLPIFHAAGHFAYAKSAQIYLQDMAELSKVMDASEYDTFTKQGYFTIRRSEKKWAGIWTDMTVEQTLMRTMKTFGGLTHGRGINHEGVLARWILGMPVTFEVMDAFEKFTGIRTATSEQHTDWRPTSFKRDTEDYLKFVEWLTAHNPFVPVEGDKLMSIATGLCGDQEVDCDKAIEIGKKSMETMIGENAADLKLKRSTRVKSLAITKRGVVINGETVAVNTTLLFQRITAATKNDSTLATEALNYELAPFPLSLFDENGMMRESPKSKLYELFSPEPFDEELQSKILLQSKTVVDGGFLLHKVVWPVGSTYNYVFELYSNYVIKNYGNDSVVVFDGYERTDIGTKSYERFKRSKGIKSKVIMFDKDMAITVKQDKFLSNDQNKRRLISFLKNHLIQEGIEVKQATEDADRLIATTAIEQLASHQKVTVVGQDVDLLVLLIALTPTGKGILFFKPSVGKGKSVMFSTEDHKSFKDVILLSHAFTGCDTTSAMYGKGKKSFLKTLIKDKKLLPDVGVFNNCNAEPKMIKEAGERLMLALYKATGNDKSINSLRSTRFAVSAARLKTEVRLAQLPPTAGATEEHVWRVYYQVQKWLGNDTLRPCDWGWELKENVYFPIMTRMPVAPTEILNMIFCTCKGDCTSRCGCKKAGLKCSKICSNCQGDSCLNSMETDVSSDSTERSNNSDDVLLHDLDSRFSQHVGDVATGGLEEDSEFVPFDCTQDDFEDESGPSTSKKRRLNDTDIV